MGRKSNGSSLMVAGIAAAAYAYFSKPENRDKAMVQVNNLKTKFNAYMDQNATSKSSYGTAGHPDPQDVDDNKMVDEGAMTSVQYYNEEVQDKSSKKEKTDVSNKEVDYQ
ncbi:hypothetical protein MKY84_12400 [Chryseomicrobium sp. FSL W7-1435]|uniref:hypothetical protein n=1 Tax=Chryseomicrobium sp. FSL W7-1435 TaxID=2921704 RepID=UPI003159F718